MSSPQQFGTKSVFSILKYIVKNTIDGTTVRQLVCVRLLIFFMDIQLMAKQIAEFAFAESEKMRQAGLLPGNLIAKMRQHKADLEVYIVDLLSQSKEEEVLDPILPPEPKVEVVKATNGKVEMVDLEPGETEAQELARLTANRVWLHGTGEEKARFKALKEKLGK